ncbi:MAG: hypothetical protein ACJAUD_002249, partial [Crocinitomicaceae bacterium]
ELLTDHNERVVLEYFDISSWLRSKIKKISFEEEIKMRLKK